MNREVVLVTAALVVCGLAVLLMSWVPVLQEPAGGTTVGGRQLERRTWRRLWLPVLPAAIALAVLVGWACQEPSLTDETLRPLAVLTSVPVGLLWLRCAVRACFALRRPRAMPAVATLGLLRPRIVAADGLEDVLDPEALSAAIAHERAHVRHLDPLRIWLAQIATDIQWPNPRAGRRFEHWLTSLELARDEEARLRGTPGEDLAAAIVAVAKMARPFRRAAMVGLTGPQGLAARVYRLLESLPPDDCAGSLIIPLAVVAALAASVAIGVEHGDLFLRALPFIAK